MSRRAGNESPPEKGAGEPLQALMSASREYSTAAVVFHNAVAGRFGLSVTDLKALDVLQRVGPQTAGDIARHTGLASASITSLIDRLETKRLVRRRRDAADRRRVLVEVTATLEKTVAPVFAPLNARLLARVREYGEAEMALIRGFLEGAASDMRDEASKV